MISSLHQPIHTVYGGAHLFKSTTCTKLGALAEQSISRLRARRRPLWRRFSAYVPESAGPRTVHARVSRKAAVASPSRIFASISRTDSGFAPMPRRTRRLTTLLAEVTAAVQSQVAPAHVWNPREVVSHGAYEGARAANAGSFSFPGDAARELRGHAAEDHRARASLRVSRVLFSPIPMYASRS